MVALAGCGTPQAPTSTPTGGASEPTPGTTPTPSPSVNTVALPSECDSLVRTSVVREQFGENFELIALPSPSSPDAQVFADRGGLTCLWGIPQSEASITVFAAQRATGTDEEQVKLWQAAGYSECPPFLDACFVDVVNNELGEYRTVHVLVAGFELQVQAGTDGIDPLLIIAREAANNMGYL